MSALLPHSTYTATALIWQTWRDAYAGGTTVKARGETYLARPAGMRRDAQYNAYKNRALWFGATERAVHGLTGAIFRKPPQLDIPTALITQLDDVTLTGVPFEAFAEELIRETLLMGRFGVLIDFSRPVISDQGIPVTNPVSRPYWVAYPTEEILNWRTAQLDGQTVLTLVVLREGLEERQGDFPSPEFFVTETVTQYRVLRLDEQGQYEVSLWREVPTALRRTAEPDVVMVDRWVPTRTGEPLTTIPFCFFSPFTLETNVEKSLMDALIASNYQYYRHSADYEHGLHLTALPTPWVTGYVDDKTELLIGSQAAWIIPDAAAKVGMLEFQGQGLQSHERAMEADINNMATLGARLLEGQPLVQETAAAVHQRSEGSESPLQALVMTASQGLTKLAQWHAWWANLTENPADPAILAQLNTDLTSSQADPTMVKTLMEALLSGTISFETWYWNLQRGELARPQVLVEDEQELIAIREAARPMPTGPTEGGGVSPLLRGTGRP